MKKWLGLFSGAWIGVATHKLRSFLTILGVVIGVAAVIALMSIGRGTEVSIISNMESLGADLLFIRPGTVTQAGVRSAFGSASTLTVEDGEAIAKEVSDIVAVAPASSVPLQIVAGSQNMNAQVSGVTPDYQIVYNLDVAEGTFITQYDYRRAARIAVIGSNVKDTLFPDSDPVGQSLRVGRSVVRVVGVMESKGTSMLGSADDAVLVPLTALYSMFTQSRTTGGQRTVRAIAVKVTDRELSTSVKDEITTLLRIRHRLAPDADNDFQVTSMEEIINRVSAAINSMTFLLGAIAAISLLVGGIGVMNIMLVSVVERTREIGIRKALGAKEWDIWGQFLTEAALLTFTGGLIGVAFGWGASTLVSNLTTLKTLVSPDIVLLAVAISVSIGLFFGFYPAWHASRLNPIESLRAE